MASNNNNHVSVDEYILTKAATADPGYFATYQLFKGDTPVGNKINIPRNKACHLPIKPDM